MPDGDLFLALRDRLADVQLVGGDGVAFTARCPGGDHRFDVIRAADGVPYMACFTCGDAVGVAVGRLLDVDVAPSPAPAPAVAPPRFHWLAELLTDPAALRPPEAVAERFAWRGRVTMLAAREKAGKTTLAAYVAARVSAGQPVLADVTGAPPTPRRVLWVILEGHPGDLYRALVAFGANADHVAIATHLPDGLPSLRALVADARPELLVIDTLSSLAERYIEDMSGDAAGWTRVMNTLGQLAREADLALLVDHHARKSDGRYRDSTAIGAGCDMILEMEEVPEDPTLRKLAPRGRWALDPFSVRLADGRFQLGEREASVEVRVLDYIRAHPGASLTAVRQGANARAGDVDAAVRTLLHRQMIADEVQGGRHRYRVLMRDGFGTGLLDFNPSRETPAGQAPDEVGTGSGQPQPVPYPNPGRVRDGVTDDDGQEPPF
jgi:hypothetical protein